MNACPHCGGALPSSRSTTWQHQQIAAGLCVSCRQPKDAHDAPYWRCTPCRRTLSDQLKARRQRRSGVGLMR